jgi:SAM-dependent methyltransferase
MNQNHAALCPSPEWAEWLQNEVLEPLLQTVELGATMLEVGPGPGAATSCLRHRVRRLVVLEVDAAAARGLLEKFAGTNVEVVVGDGAAMDFADESFDSAGCFTMLHHVPSPALQERLLAEMHRVLRPGGVLVGSDSLASHELEAFHEGDTYNPVDPDTLPDRLRRLGFVEVAVNAGDVLTFVAAKPSTSLTVAANRRSPLTRPSESNGVIRR